MTGFPAVLAIILSLVILGSISAWIFALKKLVSRQPLLTFEPRESPRWSLLEIFITVVLMFTLQTLAVVVLGMADSSRDDVAPISAKDSQEIASQEPPPPDLVFTGRIMVLGGVASLIACGLGGLLIVTRTGCSWGQDLGLTMRHAARDVSYGVVAYVMLAPIIGAIQAALQHWYPSEHPLIEKFREQPTLGFYLVCVFAAAIVAPLVEEFICRVLVQGWLERVFAAKSIKHALFPDSVRDCQTISTTASETSMPAGAEAGLKLIDAIYAVPSEGEPELDLSPSPSQSPSGFPIILSSLLFAVMHWGHGLDPIPLFFLALGLGYLYQRTHRILPCVVLHFLVNSFALAVLAQSLVSK